MIETLLFILVGLGIAVVVLQILVLRRAAEAGMDEEQSDPVREAEFAADLARRTAEALDPSNDRRAASLRAELTLSRSEQAEAAERLRETVSSQAALSRSESAKVLASQRSELLESLQRLAATLDAQLGSIRTLTQQKLDETRTLTQQKLDEMRGVVEEKLQKALEERVGAAFKGVGERLEEVQRGLGEMRTIAGEVGDL
ncbi:MAG: hypothetical protein FJ253_08770, partial [Phycisphaerae bacterium]|nr:hypothetical protein [Phycisphaerae bacterium]